MKNKLMMGLWRYIINVPPFLWEKQIAMEVKKFEKAHGFMTDDHRQVHHFVVKALPGVGRPITPGYISKSLNLPADRTIKILDDLETHMTFLFRNKRGEVVWAYPVTVEKTPHHVTFNTGETLYAAWAADAFATPFVQGRLRNEYIRVTVKTECSHCKTPMEFDIDSELEVTTKDPACELIAFVPDINLSALEDDSIIDAFWKESVFFRSEAHAKTYRKTDHRLRGGYFKPAQMAYMTRIVQSAIFKF